MTPYKLIFYAMYFIAGVILINLLMALIDDLLKLPYFKVSQIIIDAVVTAIVIIGTILAHQKGYKNANYTQGIITFGITWVVAVLTAIIGELFFNGPLNWH